MSAQPDRLPPQREYHVLNLGAGVQSTTLYLMFMRGEITPQIDAAVFADTQDEPKAVYRHLQWLGSLGGPRIIVVSKGRLSDDLLKRQNSSGHRFTLIPSFTNFSGRTGKSKRQCSSEYKIKPILQGIRRQICGCAPGRSPARSVTVHQYIGISLDECGRARRIMDAKRPRYQQVHFPLIEKFMMRSDCLTYLADKVPHPTPRSACVHCPLHSDYEWNQIKQEPDEWDLARRVDIAIRPDQMFLHRSLVPLDLVQLDTRPDPRKAQLSINFAAECMGVCGV